jgi:hypothetical protein
MPDSDADRLIPEPRASIDSDKGAGLYDDFEAYRTPTDSDYHELFTSGLIIPDTNVFLNLYRYNEQTRNDLLSVLSGLGGHLWVPHQVMAEFWRNREAVLKDPQDTVSCIRQLSTHQDQATGAFRAWANRVSLPQERSANLLHVITNAFDEVINEVSELSDENSWEAARDTNTDRVLDSLRTLLQGHVGRPLAKAEHDEALKEAKSRAEQKRPPGYKDHNKTDGGAAGDYLIWVQVLREARASQRDVLLITGDVKEDWWRREHGEARGPRPELVREIKEYANVKLYMLRPESLLIRARQALQIAVHDESVQDAERVDRSLSEASSAPGVPAVDADLVRQSWDDIINAVRDRRRVASQFLRTATVDSLDEDALTVRFRRSADAKGFIDSESGTALSEALNEVLGIERGITVIVSENRHLGTYGPRSWPSSDAVPSETGDPAGDDTQLSD